jgi:hypothetical protein
MNIINVSFRRTSAPVLVLAIAALLHCLAGKAFAQRSTASVAGSIVDESESAVPGARIVIRNLATGLERTVDSNDLGYYAVPALPTGPYSVTVSKTGFQTQSVPQLILEVDQNATIKISLKVGAISEAVSVTAEATTLDTRTATLSTVINQKQINDLPLNGRNVLQLMQLTPGTLVGSGTFNQSATRPEVGSQLISASGGGETHNHAHARRDQGGAQRHAERDPGSVENARENVASQLVPTQPMTPRWPGQRPVEVLLQGIVGRHPGADGGHKEKERHEREPGHRRAVAREASPRHRGRSST